MIKQKKFLKLNLVSLFLIALSFISVTLAWFAYSGLSKVSTEVNVKAWYIQLEKDGEKASNDIVISLNEIYPGMETVTETIKVTNMGDSDANLKYSILSARFLGNPSDYFLVNDTVTSAHLEDLISHDFPFNVNISLSKNYAKSKGDESVFEISVSWPLDSDHDELDSEWGTKAYNFHQEEQEKKRLDSSYEVRPSVKIEINLTAEQYLNAPTDSDWNYNMGDSILIDVVSNKRCASISSTCIKTYVLDPNNTLGDTKVNLLPNPFMDHITSTFDDYDLVYQDSISSWTVPTRPLVAGDIAKVVSKDVDNSFLIREGISDSIIGALNSSDRIQRELEKVINYNGYYRFLNNRFPGISGNECYWTSTVYNSTNGFAIKKIDDTVSKIYGNPSGETCKVVPVIVMDKVNLDK